MSDGYRVDPDALQTVAKGINAAIDELKSLGIDESGEVGRGFSNIELTGMELGNAGLRGAFDGFCERWSWGVRALVHDGNEIASRLGLSAGLYHDQEQYVENMLKDVVNASMGNPHLTQEQVEAQSWSKTLSDNSFNDFRHADLSEKSLQETLHHSAQTWKAEGRDMMDGPMGLRKDLADAAGYGAQYDQAQNEMFGPEQKSQ
ncbi:hypothetical protein ACFY2T_32895 [Streptomyces sp. NPDC001260]|uniref:hypothetical protein n=1 Tax=Streptomyces sp. NPDC001260 TaxID=3364551 RepID=UPI0036BBBBB3